MQNLLSLARRKKAAIGRLVDTTGLKVPFGCQRESCSTLLSKPPKAVGVTAKLTGLYKVEYNEDEQLFWHSKQYRECWPSP